MRLKSARANDMSILACAATLALASMSGFAAQASGLQVAQAEQRGPERGGEPRERGGEPGRRNNGAPPSQPAPQMQREAPAARPAPERREAPAARPAPEQREERRVQEPRREAPPRVERPAAPAQVAPAQVAPQREERSRPIPREERRVAPETTIERRVAPVERGVAPVERRVAPVERGAAPPAERRAAPQARPERRVTPRDGRPSAREREINRRREVYRAPQYYDDRRYRARPRDFVFLGGPRVIVRNYGPGWCRGLHRGYHWAPRIGWHRGTHRGLFRCVW